MQLQVTLMGSFERSLRLFSKGRNLMTRKSGICTQSENVRQNVLANPACTSNELVHVNVLREVNQIQRSKSQQ